MVRRLVLRMLARNSGSYKSLRLNPVRGVTLWPPAVFDLPETLIRDSTEPMQNFAMNFFLNYLLWQHLVWLRKLHQLGHGVGITM